MDPGYADRLEQVARKEQHYAYFGGLPWKRYVVWAEGLLGKPWSTIREEINVWHEQHGTYAR